MADKKMLQENDFSKGNLKLQIIKLSIPMMISQFINVLYSVVDRLYIGRIPGTGIIALTGIGLSFPIIIIITAFANLCGSGGAPLSSIARGEKNHEKVEKIIANAAILLVTFATILIVFGYIFKIPVLYWAGASETTIAYANEYLSIYLAGTYFMMINVGLNVFISAQGYAKTSMLTVLLGAVVNIVLDPIFIFVFNMGVSGAAIATVIAQGTSAFWVMYFLTKKKGILKFRKNKLFNFKTVKQILALGLSGFTMSITNGTVGIACNTTLQYYGGDIYVGIMTIINSIRDLIQMPALGLRDGAQPVTSYNYGAKKYDRVLLSTKFLSIILILYSTVCWIIIMAVPGLLISLFNNDPDILAIGVPSIRIYFMAFIFMSLQMLGQATFLALGKAKQAIFFSLLRKAVLVIPLVILLPRISGLNVSGVFWAEPISELIGGVVCFGTMVYMIRKKIKPKILNNKEK